MRFSVVTPSFRQIDQLELCISSVADQSECGAIPLHIEHIICDAGSPGIEDFRERMLARFSAAKNYRLEFVVAQDSGMYDAINKGLKRSTGDFCAYLNCDEQYLDGALDFVDRWFARNPAAEVAFGNIVVTTEEGSYICDRAAVLPEKWHTMTSGNLSVFSAGTFFRRESIIEQNLFFDPAWRAIGDSVWILALLEAKLNMRLIGRPVASFSYSSESLSMQAQASAERELLRESAPVLARWLASVAIAFSRCRRLAAGGYRIAPHSYRIYTRNNPARRTEFHVPNPTHRWPTA
jgi:glycosyltransferase involved in cell wall biosynthesis